jgi:hypothetical protein
MSILTATIFDILASDAPLVAMLSEYQGAPAIFTTDPVPGDKEVKLPYIVTAGEVSQSPWDTKNTRGRQLIRDVRFYAPADGSAVLIEAMVERGRALLHRQPLVINGFKWVISDCGGPIVADESGAYGRILSLSLKAQEE